MFNKICTKSPVFHSMHKTALVFDKSMHKIFFCHFLTEHVCYCWVFLYCWTLIAICTCFASMCFYLRIVCVLLLYAENNYVSSCFNLTPLVFFERKWSIGESINTFIYIILIYWVCFQWLTSILVQEMRDGVCYLSDWKK